MLLKGMIIILELFVMPMLAGRLLLGSCLKGEKTDSAIKEYLMGFFLTLAIFWVLYIPMLFLRLPFNIFVYVFSFFMVSLCSISLYLSYKNRKGKFIKKRKINLGKFEIIYLLLFFILLTVQIYFAIFGDVTVWSYDDYSYVVRALDAISNNSIQPIDPISGTEVSFNAKRILNSWEILIAFWAKTSGFHVTTVAHTILPALLLLVAYMVYYYIAKKLFEKRENQFIFLILLSLAHIFGLYSPYSLTFRLLATLWQGKAVLSAIVLPFLIGFLMEIYREEGRKINYLYLLIISMAASSLTMMGAGMVIVVYGSMFVVMSLYKKRITGIKYTLCGCLIPIGQIIVYLNLR